jgi:hypothetical protein
MKISVVFIKDHKSGLKKGKVVTFQFIHAARLIDEGWVEPENKDEFDQMAETYKEQQKKIQDLVKQRIADLKAAQEEGEQKVKELREKNAEAKKVRMTAKDIEPEEKFPKQNKNPKGGKK